jgi:hypothetical protein
MDAKRLTLAAAAFACATSMLSISGAVARDRLYVGPLYHGGYIADQTGLPWYAVRAYYSGGPWVYGYSGWADYALRNGIGCTPGTLIKGGDGIMYVCQ